MNPDARMPSTPHLHLDRIVGVIKCHATRVGEGPFLSEIHPSDARLDAIHPCGTVKSGQQAPLEKELVDRRGNKFHPWCRCSWCRSHKIREQGNEFGTTTGRPRRIGWFDIEMTNRAIALTGATEIALMHTDTMSGIDPKIRNEAGELEGWPGWTDVHDENFANFRNTLSKRLGVPITMVSYGPGREELEIL